MEIRISKTYSKGGYIEPGDNMEDLPLEEEIVALFTHDDGRQTFLDFSADDMKEIDVFLIVKGWVGHIPFHDWLKLNRPSYFRQNITDRDPEGIVLSLLAKLKEFLQIKS